MRPSTREELDVTTVLSLPIVEASAKMRSGGANDAEKDLAHPVGCEILFNGSKRAKTVVRTPQAQPLFFWSEIGHSRRFYSDLACIDGAIPVRLPKSKNRSPWPLV